MKHLYLLLLLTGCQLAVNDRVDIEDLDFETTDASELFFKNVRQSAYDLEERSEAKMNVFRMRDRNTDSSSLSVAIIHHWMLDRAYIWLEPGPKLPEVFDLLLIANDTQQTISFDGSSPKNHAEVATAMFHTLLDNGRVILDEQELIPQGSAERETFRLVLNDYYRLVGLK